MTNPINNGGPAFPGRGYISGHGEIAPIQTGPDSWDWQTQNQGMTLRDYFAAKAMQGDWSCQPEGEDYSTAIYDHAEKLRKTKGDDAADQHITNSFDGLAAMYYAIADAMLKARKQ